MIEYLFAALLGTQGVEPENRNLEALYSQEISSRLLNPEPCDPRRPRRSRAYTDIHQALLAEYDDITCEEMKALMEETTDFTPRY